jgi:surfeit locus 1 family protein
LTADGAQPRPRSLLWPAVATLIGCVFLILLGVWQLHRLAWKEGLIAEIAARAKAPPQPLPPQSEWAQLRPDDYEYRHVELDGAFDNGKEALVFRPAGGAARGPGYLVLTPLKLDSGAYVIVNRGFVSVELKDPAARGEIEGRAHVTGLMRQPESRNFFTPADDPETDQYFTRDPALIAGHFGLAPAAPFSVDADENPKSAVLPRGGASELTFPNNHLAYALTWFGLALALIGVFAVFARQRR